MRIFYPLLFFIYFSAVSFSQIPASAVAPEDAAFNLAYSHHSVPKVTGRLLNFSAEELKNNTITYTLVTPFANSQEQKTVSVQPDGSFSLKLEYALPYQQIWFSVGDLFYASLYANKDLHVELDMKKIKAAKGVSYNGDGVRYLGTDGLLNIYLNNYVLYRRPEQQQLSNRLMELVHPKKTINADFLSKYDQLFDSIKIIEDSYIAAHPSPYSWLLGNERMSDYYAQICLEYWGEKMDDGLWQKMKQHKSYLITNNSAQLYSYITIYLSSLPGEWVPTNWKDVAELTDLDATESALIDSLKNSETLQPAYPYTPENIKKWSGALGPRIQKITLVRVLNTNIRRLDSLFPPYKADFLKLRINSSKDLNEQKLALQYLLPSMHTSWCIDVVKSEYKHASDKLEQINKMLAYSKKGTLSGDFAKPLMATSFGATMYKASDIKAIDFLQKLKHSFKGKAIIIDRWATWCNPCLSEMPYSKKLEEESKDLPVIFVYLCTVKGSSESKWKSKVAEIQQPGIHILIDEALDAELSDYFSWGGYPGYALIDKAGNYKPGAITWMSSITDKKKLAALIKE